MYGEVLGVHGRPVPPPSVVARLKAIDPQLELAYQGHPSGDQMQYGWRVRRQWDTGDPRWAQVRSGALEPAYAYDMVCIVPKDCAADDIPAYLVQGYRRFDREDFRQASRRVAQWNKRQQEAVIQEGVDLTEQLAVDNAATLTRTTKVYQNETRRRKRAK